MKRTKKQLCHGWWRCAPPPSGCLRIPEGERGVKKDPNCPKVNFTARLFIDVPEHRSCPGFGASRRFAVTPCGDCGSFAESCEVSPDGFSIRCQCTEGYYGSRCEACAAGYFGTPEVQGGSCQPCQCSGNIDVEDPGSCDSVTGDCLRCLNNTEGPACSLCAPGFFGDAVVIKDCQSKCLTWLCCCWFSVSVIMAS